MKASGTKTRYFGLSEAGQVRAVNQDSFFVEGGGESGTLALVADGMGGHKTGEVASQKAVQIVAREFARARAHPPAAIARAVRAANLAIYEYAVRFDENRGMGTTLTLVYLDDQVGLVGHVGDSRAYLVREGEFRQLTQDHSWVAERVRQGLLTEEEAKGHRWRSVITNALGATPEIKLDLGLFELRRGDRILLCSDGVSMLLFEEHLARIVRENEPEEEVRQLIDEANAQGSPDNITAVVVSVDELEARKKNYAPSQESGVQLSAVSLTATMSGVRRVEEAFPLQDALSTLRRRPWYPQRYWLMGCAALLVLILVFSLR
ncbi:hypothetical protein BH24DEI1_BH24DEI1_03050 [soil metagenome]